MFNVYSIRSPDDSFCFFVFFFFVLSFWIHITVFSREIYSRVDCNYHVKRFISVSIYCLSLLDFLTNLIYLLLLNISLHFISFFLTKILLYPIKIPLQWMIKPFYVFISNDLITTTAFCLCNKEINNKYTL